MKKYIITLVAVLTLMSTPVLASEQKVDRLAGANRFETAVEISKSSYDKSDVVILSSNTGEADSLTGTILAREKNAPLLLIQKDVVPDSVKKELIRLSTKQIYILGGSSVISEAVEAELNKSYEVIRIAGKDRLETAIKISEEITNVKDEYFLVLGYDTLADALSIGPVSAKEGIPILLTSKNKLPQATLDKIIKDKPSKIIIIGGFSAVSKEVENQIPDEIQVERIAGSNRIDTSIDIAKKYYTNVDSVILANGFTMADALVGGHLSAKNNAPIILSNPNKTTDTTIKYIDKSSITVLGGTKAIGNEVVNKLTGQNLPVEIVPVKINNKAELKQIVTKKFMNRTSEIEIEYHGGDIKTSSEAIDFMKNELRTNSDYNLANGSLFWTTFQAKTNSVYIKYRQDYRTTVDEEKFIDKEVARIISKIITPGMSELQKAVAINDYMANNITYSKDTIGSPHSSYTLFKENKGVCNAYTLASMKMFEKAGLESLYVMGYGKTGKDLHAWNKVKIDGVWYNIDVTWAHPVSTTMHNAYYYFLNSDSRFYQTHTPLSKLGLPQSVDKRYDGKHDKNYRREGSF